MVHLGWFKTRLRLYRVSRAGPLVFLWPNLLALKPSTRVRHLVRCSIRCQPGESEEQYPGSCRVIMVGPWDRVPSGVLEVSLYQMHSPPPTDWPHPWNSGMST